MRVLFYGNSGNIGFRITQWLREVGIDAHLFISVGETNSRSLPEWENPELENNYPAWISVYKPPRFSPSILLFTSIKEFARGLFFFRKLHRLTRFKPTSKVLKQSKNFDIVLTTGTNVIEAMHFSKPVIYIPVGKDITQVPFLSGSFREELFSYLYRQRIKNISSIINSQKDIIWAARLLQVGNRITRLPGLFVDVYKTEKNINHDFFKEIKNKYKDYDFVFINTTRKNLVPDKVNYKGNDKLLKAYKKFVDTNKSKKVLMLSGIHGHNAERFKEMVKDLKLEQHIEYLEHLSLPFLHAYFSLPNAIVFDQFTYNKDNLNGTQRESLALGRITVSSTDPSTDSFREAYGEDCPMIHASTMEEIYQVMEKVISFSPDDLKRKEKEIRQWTIKNLHWENRIQEIIRLMKDTVNRCEG